MRGIRKGIRVLIPIGMATAIAVAPIGKIQWKSSASATSHHPSLVVRRHGQRHSSGTWMVSGFQTLPTTTTTQPPAPLPPTPVASVPATTTPTPTPAPASSGSSLPGDYAAWTRVADCEEGGWVGSSGAAYPDSLGIDAANWYANGGGSDTSPAAQIAVANHLVESIGMGIPDQNGCASW